jgi:hypothetical protein
MFAQSRNTLIFERLYCSVQADQNYFTDQTELKVMSYVETYEEATRVEIL